MRNRFAVFLFVALFFILLAVPVQKCWDEIHAVGNLLLSKTSNQQTVSDRVQRYLPLFLTGFNPKAVIPSNIKNVSLINRPLSQGVFLVATHELGESYFRNTVILLAKYSHKGALGVIINRPSGISLPDALPDFRGLGKDIGTLFIGGPVARLSPFLLLRTERETKNTHHIFDNTFYSTNIQVIIRTILNRKPNEKMRVYAGYAGWAPGQLEVEVARGSWLVFRADQYTIFDKDPVKIWDDMIRGEIPLFIKKNGKNLIAS